MVIIMVLDTFSKIPLMMLFIFLLITQNHFQKKILFTYVGNRGVLKLLAPHHTILRPCVYYGRPHYSQKCFLNLCILHCHFQNSPCHFYSMRHFVAQCFLIWIYSFSLLPFCLVFVPLPFLAGLPSI